MIDLTTIRHVADIPREQARVRGAKAAFLYEGKTTSFSELDTRSNQVANGLMAAGAEVQDRIGYLGKNMDIYYEILFGAAKARMAMTGVNWRLARDELKFIITDAQISVLFVGLEYHQVIAEIMNECPSLRMIISLDTSWGAWPAYVDWRAAQSDTDPKLQIEDEDDVVQLYTSGTTGLPKGVQLTDANYMGLFVQAAELEWSSYNPGESVMNAMPLFHVAGVNIGMLSVLQGARAVILREIDPGLILDLVEQEKIAHAFWVPAVILMLTQQPG
ncbi:MAG: AMP-binding protein, partial [Hyphomonadaceae bacterium]|nr:AMP-binding protein [Hyphomonadaceae bacterium]